MCLYVCVCVCKIDYAYHCQYFVKDTQKAMELNEEILQLRPCCVKLWLHEKNKVSLLQQQQQQTLNEHSPSSTDAASAPIHLLFNNNETTNNNNNNNNNMTVLPQNQPNVGNENNNSYSKNNSNNPLLIKKQSLNNNTTAVSPLKSKIPGITPKCGDDFTISETADSMLVNYGQTGFKNSYAAGFFIIFYFILFYFILLCTFKNTKSTKNFVFCVCCFLFVFGYNLWL